MQGTMTFLNCSAEDLLDTLEDNSIELLLTDPPYYDIVNEDWDRKFSNPNDFADWLSSLFLDYYKKLTPTGSLVFFSGFGKHRSHPLFRVLEQLEYGRHEGDVSG